MNKRQKKKFKTKYGYKKFRNVCIGCLLNWMDQYVEK